MSHRSIAITHDPAHHRFVSDVDGGTAYLSYVPRGDDALDFEHTVVPPESEGGGVAAALTRAAMDFARSEGVHVIPTCPYVQAWLRKHPGYRDLVASQ